MVKNELKIFLQSKVKNDKNNYKQHSNPKVLEKGPPKVGMLILNVVSKFTKVKNETKKRPQ